VVRSSLQVAIRGVGNASVVTICVSGKASAVVRRVLIRAPKASIHRVVGTSVAISVARATAKFRAITLLLEEIATISYVGVNARARVKAEGATEVGIAKA